VLFRSIIVVFIAASSLVEFEVVRHLHSNTLFAAVFTGLAAVVGYRRRGETPTRVARRWSWPKLALVGYLALSLVRSVTNDWFVLEFPKIALLFLTAFSFHRLDPTGRGLRLYFLTAVVCVLIICVLNLPRFDLRSLSDMYRFEIDSFGSFNALGFLLGTNLVMLLFVMEGSLAGKSLWVLVAASLFFLLLTLSRGGLAALLASASVFVFAKHGSAIRSAVRTIIYCVLVGVILVLILHYLMPEGGAEAVAGRFDAERDPTGSGRLLMWAVMMDQLASNPHQILIGAGIGGINVEVFGRHAQRSAHNIYLDMLFYFGAVGVGFLVAGLVRLYRRLKAGRGPLRALRMAILAELAVVGLIDSFWGTAQLLWFNALLFYVVMTRDEVTEAEKPTGEP
jgi:hypothetical protein